MCPLQRPVILHAESLRWNRCFINVISNTCASPFIKGLWDVWMFFYCINVCGIFPPPSVVGEADSWPWCREEVPGSHWGVCQNQGGQPVSPGCGGSTSQVQTPTHSKASDYHVCPYVGVNLASKSKCYFPFLHCSLDWKFPFAEDPLVTQLKSYIRFGYYMINVFV